MPVYEKFELIELIKAKTLLAIELVHSERSEACEALLQERHKLIELLFSDFQQTLASDAVFKDQVVNLCVWIQQQDSPSVAILNEQKNTLKSKFIKQNRAKKAVLMYSKNKN